MAECENKKGGKDLTLSRLNALENISRYDS